MRILIADDELFFRTVLQSTLEEWGYEVVAVDNGATAWEELQKPDAPKLAILDWQMPGLNGLDICRRLRETPSPEPTYVLMLTCREGRENIIEAFRAGADDFVSKPFDREELQVRLQSGLRIIGLQTSMSVVFAFARAVEAKNPYTHGHSERVCDYSLRMAKKLGVDGDDLEILRKGALLHDIGKIAVPDSILDKAGPLTDREFRLMKEHPAEGVRIIEPMTSLKECIPLIRWHHERLNGRGYPDGLRGDEIPLPVRILSVADVYDALHSDRPYRTGLSHAECVSILRWEASEGGLEADLVELFSEVVNENDCVAEGLDAPAMTPSDEGAEADTVVRDMSSQEHIFNVQ